MSAHSVAEVGDGQFTCLCGEVVPVQGSTRDARSRAFHIHTNAARAAEQAEREEQEQ